MATAGCVQSEELLCPICLDLLSQPVSTPCGHNFCSNCIRGYWESASVSQCPMCKQRFHRRPELKVNTFISELASRFRKSMEEEDGIGGAERCEGDAWCDVCVGRRVRAAQSCLECLASFCATHLEPHHVLATLKEHRLVDPVMNMRERVCRKHEKLLDAFCHTDQMYVCQMCSAGRHGAHRTVPIEDESRDKRARIAEIHAEVEAMIRERREKIGEVTRSIEQSRRNADVEIEESVQIFAELLRCVQHGQAELADAIAARQRQVEADASGLVRELEREIAALQRRSSELERLSRTRDHLYLLLSFPEVSAPPEDEGLCDAAVPSAVYVGTARRVLRRAAGRLEERAKAEARRLCQAEFLRARECAAEVTLDPDTAHPKLVLDGDGTRVHHGDVAMSAPDHPARFYPGVSVLGREGFSSGRFYFEVQVKGKTEWDVGVARGSVSRKGGSTLSPESGFWVLGLRCDGGFWALSSPPVRVPLVQRPQRVAVFADLEGGQVSFYDADSASHIYSFTECSFGERLFPYLNPRRNHGGINSAPLCILPVST